MNRPTYTPPEPWTSYDFRINQVYWSKRPTSERDQIRLRNLRDLSNALSQHNIIHWLYGKTLLGAWKNQQLPDDHDDDIGIFVGQRPPLLDLIERYLKKDGFRLIRNTEDIISVEREYRYIDICLFRRKGRKRLGYKKRHHPRHHFEQLEQVKVDASPFPAPGDSGTLLERTYKSQSKLGDATGRGLRKAAQIRHPKKVKDKTQSLLANRAPRHGLGRAALRLNMLTPFQVRYKILSESDFRNLHLEPSESFNWRWRKRHLDLVTDNGRLSMIGDIVDHLADPQVQEKINTAVVESDTTSPFADPANLDIDFWWSGNNYFWYCVWYQFRHNVHPYARANEYIRNIGDPPLFSSRYYETLPEMGEHDIDRLLKNNPIEVTNGAITGGKHRALAMVGRLVFGKSYRPVPIIELS
ncbi:hypothetical protein [Halorhodospira halophila]|uniref:hypothetical protein n=1 Tax=Halorhodospira halophila TaxID=1053 RepID=UPI0019121D5F|nr:hypothetical protein [Halorhodospira halophila]